MELAEIDREIRGESLARDGLRCGRLKPSPKMYFAAQASSNELYDDGLRLYFQTSDAHAIGAGRHIAFFADLKSLVVDDRQGMLD